VLTPKQEQIILGSLLGDGHLRRPPGVLFSTKGCDKSKDYVFWKYEELKPSGLFSRPPKSSPGRARTGTTRSWSFYSKRNSVFNEYRQLFYPNGKKIVTREILNKLDNLGLAVWYMDDGSRSKAKKHVRLATQSFGQEGFEVISEWLWEKYRLHSFPDIRRNSSRMGWALRFRMEDSKRFLGITRPHMIPCMSGKWGV